MKTYFFFLYSLFSFLFSFSLKAQVVFENLPTSENMTVLINLSTTPMAGTSPIALGDYIGAFYTDNAGDLKCGGFTTWNGNPSTAISFPIYENDNATTTIDGFETGDSFIWKIKTLSDGIVYDATAIYNNNSPYTTTYINDGFVQVTSFSTSTTPIPGCTDPLYTEYNPLANEDDGSCATLIVNGCTDPLYLEFNPTANTDDGSCSTLIVNGCMDTAYLEYNPLANVDDGSCTTLKVYGCTDNNYIEYNAAANVDNGTCVTEIVFGCMDTAYLEYNPLANVDDGSCATLKVYGCTDEDYFEYNAAANVDNGTCLTLKINGCTDPEAQNYNSSANFDDGSCDYTCSPGFIEVTVRIVTNSNIASGWFLYVNGNNFAGETSSEIQPNTDITHHYCIQEGANVTFSSANLVSYEITRCGFNVSPYISNPNNSGFVANCLNIGLEEFNDSQINIFPNPTKQNLSISSKQKINQIEIFDIMGKKVMTSNSNFNIINTSNLEPGIYNLKMILKDQTITKSFIKL